MNLPLPRLTILDDATKRDLHTQALSILGTKGFKVPSSSMRAKLAAAGAAVDDAREVVTLPAELIAEAVSAAPGAFEMYDLDGNRLGVGPGTITDTVGTYIEAINWLDFGASRLRPSTLADLQTALKVADALPLVKRTGAVVWPLDVPQERQLAEVLFAILSSTRKTLGFGIQNRRDGQLIVDALSVAADGVDLRKKPVASFTSSPTSPLVFDSDSAETLMLGLEFGLVPSLAPCPMAGGTSQFSIIGTVLQQVTELLFMVTAVYAIRAGSAVVWGGAGAAMDMRVGDVSYGGQERSLMMLANSDMADYFGLPCHSPAASLDSCLIDAQYGAEKTWTYLTRCLSNAALGMGVGAVTNGKAASAEAMVIDADIIRCVKRLANGIDTKHLSKAVEEILAVDHGGNFMMSDATLELVRDENEYFIPSTFNRAGTDASSMLDRAHEQVDSILNDWTSPVPDKIVGELGRLLKG